MLRKQKDLVILVYLVLDIFLMKSEDNSYYLFQNSATDSRATPITDDGTSNPRSEETFSLFGDSSCGEPLFAQHVVVDFTPQEDIDTDYVQKKVCSFWDFIESNPEITHFKVQPEAQTFSRSDFGASVALDKSDTVLEEAEKLIDLDIYDSKAVSMLKFAEEKGLIDRIFETERADSRCSLGSREYKDKSYETLQKRRDRKKCKPGCTCTPIDTCDNCLVGTPAVKSRNRKLNRDLHDWSIKHPKSMEPPGHPPSSSHTMLGKRLFQ